MTHEKFSQIQKVRIEDVVISDITNKLYDYSNRESEIASIQQSISEIGQREPITVLQVEDKYLIIDGIIRYYAVKRLNLNEIEVLVSHFKPTRTFSLTDFIIHHQIRKEKLPSEKLKEVKNLLRIDCEDKNPLRDKENRVKLVSKLMGEKGWGRNNVFSLEKIIKWESKSDIQLNLSEKLVSNDLKINRVLDSISLIEKNGFDAESEKESQIIVGFLNGTYDKERVQILMTSYKRKKTETPTDISLTSIQDENFQLILGDAETIELPKDLKIDTIFTSPPYYKLRKYGTDPNELGWEKTPDLYVKRLVDILMKGFDKLKDTGSMFINLGETYENGQCLAIIDRVTMELMSRGALLIDKIIWDKESAKPSSNSTKRLRNVYEVIIHVAKTKDFHFERININEPKRMKVSKGCKEQFDTKQSHHIPNKYGSPVNVLSEESVGNILRIQPHNHRTEHVFGESVHPATFPTTLPFVPLLMTCPKDPTTVVFDPFSGTSSTGITSLSLGFKFVGIELYPENLETSKRVLREFNKKLSETQILDVLEEMGIVGGDIENPETIDEMVSNNENPETSTRLAA